MMPVVEQVKELLQGRVKVYQFDIDENKSKAGEAEVESVLYIHHLSQRQGDVA